MKTVAEVIEGAPDNEKVPAWREDEYGIVMYVKGIEVRVEPFLWGGAHLAVYEMIDGEPALVGEKLPVTLGTPGQNRSNS